MKIFAGYDSQAEKTYASTSREDITNRYYCAEYELLPLEVHELEVSEDCQEIYHVLIFQENEDYYYNSEHIFVETKEEAQELIRQVSGKARRRCRRWRVPVEYGQLVLF